VFILLGLLPVFPAGCKYSPHPLFAGPVLSVFQEGRGHAGEFARSRPAKGGEVRASYEMLA
jgi:hypothetical protein